MTTKPIILISNDDGYQADGITKLAAIARNFGDVVIVAPAHQQSGKSSAITGGIPLKLTKISEEEGLVVYSCDGTPADCVKLAFYTLFKEKHPDLLLSGINHGSNASVNAVYSGTIGAAMEGCINHVSSIAFSSTQMEKVLDIEKAVPYISHIIKQTLESPLPKGTMLNVNFPYEEIKKATVCREADARWSEEYLPLADDPHSYTLAGYFDNREPDSKDTDMWALSHETLSIVPIKVDKTDYEFMNQLKDIYGK
ncbi:MAG: 5'/3'-nucleotidase SurE [Paludibacteraceae bacterium]|nr:5'/3'-nucleotidase SurE [Paludibacteraceae bacterium]